MAVERNRSTKRAPVALSISYLIGSAFIGISTTTLKSLARSRPVSTRSRFMNSQKFGKLGKRLAQFPHIIHEKPASHPHAGPARCAPPLGHVAAGCLVLRERESRVG